MKNLIAFLFIIITSVSCTKNEEDILLDYGFNIEVLESSLSTNSWSDNSLKKGFCRINIFPKKSTFKNY